MRRTIPAVCTVRRWLASVALAAVTVTGAGAEETRLAAVLPGAAAVEAADPGEERPRAAPAEPEASASSDAPAPPDLAPLRQVIDLYRRGDVAGGDRLKAALNDPAARRLAEWVGLRTTSAFGFDRILDFVHENPDWPLGATARRRAEEALLAGRKPAAQVRAYFAAARPTTAAGRLALALAFKADGLDRDAAALAREIWREDSFGRELEQRLVDAFPGLLTQTDHRFRMERFLFKENWSAAQRAADLAGKDYTTLVKARIAVARKAGNAQAALNAVPERLRTDTSYLYSRAQFLRRAGKAGEASSLIAAVTRDPGILVDGDEWWVERRMIARALLDAGDAAGAYEVARGHGAESNAQRIEAEFHAGWIALRFLDDPTTAARHFAEAAATAETPISVARVAYWQGRAAEAAGDQPLARRHYERAASQPIAYYGQLARTRLGQDGLALRGVEPAAERPSEDSIPARAARLLYRAGLNDLALMLYSDLGQRLTDAGELDRLAALAAEHRDARSLLTLGKLATQRGLPLDAQAYPTIGIPAFDPVGGPVERAMVYAIARQESAFDPRAQSHVGARGLMQLMPATARRTAQRFGLGFDLDKLLDDPAYNARIGSAHLGELMEDWRGSYILTFASYNAGGGNVRKWIQAYGDPRSPGVDPVDWVERIPFSETRNYVQRVLENFQVYRRRLGEQRALLTEADLRQGRAVR